MYRLMIFKDVMIFSIFFLIVITSLPVVLAEHIFEGSTAFAQYLDIAQLSSEKFILTVDDESYDMYYGYHASLDSMVSDEPKPILSSMSINQERRSLEITFSEVPVDSVFWVRMPFEVISAEREQFQLFIDGEETQFDLTKFPNDYALGMIIPKDGQHIEIVGTKVIPEFQEIALMVLASSIVFVVVFGRKFTKFT